MASVSGEVEFAHLGVGWSCSCALDCSDESMLMVISSSSPGTLVLVPDNERRELPYCYRRRLPTVASRRLAHHWDLSSAGHPTQITTSPPDDKED